MESCAKQQEPLWEPVVEREGFLYAHVQDSLLLVTRSLMVKDTDPIYQPIVEMVGDREPTSREQVVDPTMILCRAEHLTFELGEVPRISESD